MVFNVGDPVDIFWADETRWGHYYPGSILQVLKTGYQVTFDNYPEEWNMVVPKKYVKKRCLKSMNELPLATEVTDDSDLDIPLKESVSNKANRAFYGLKLGEETATVTEFSSSDSSDDSDKENIGEDLINKSQEESEDDLILPNTKELRWRNRTDAFDIPAASEDREVVSKMRKPFEYLSDYLTTEFLENICYNTNLYARQQSINDPFNLDSKELLVFIGVSKWMSLIKLPQMHMYWAKDTLNFIAAKLVSRKSSIMISGKLRQW